jgi:GNAT superfamily N-acetyltransferase
MASATNASAVQSWPVARSGEVVDVLADAFHDYPVMRYAIGEAGQDYDRRLNRLIGLFVSGRVLRGHPILAIEEAGRVVAVATLTPPGEHPEPHELRTMWDEVWRDLGNDVKDRLERLIAVWKRLEIPGPQYHLNMLGVRRSRAKQGLGRRLLDAVHERSRIDPASAGVSLSTEDPNNVPLYQHCGYEIRGYERVSDELETWVLFRPDTGA